MYSLNTIFIVWGKICKSFWCGRAGNKTFVTVIYEKGNNFRSMWWNAGQDIMPIHMLS